MSKDNCECSNCFEVCLLRQHEYDIFKKQLNIGRHPSFIGRETYKRQCINGGALCYKFKDQIVAVSLINPRYGVLLALNIHPEHRSHGLGKSIINFLMPNFARVIESKIPFFEKMKYIKIGSPKKGRRYFTQIMARDALFQLAGNLKKVWL